MDKYYFGYEIKRHSIALDVDESIKCNIGAYGLKSEEDALREGIERAKSFHEDWAHSQLYIEIYKFLVFDGECRLLEISPIDERSVYVFEGENMPHLHRYDDLPSCYVKERENGRAFRVSSDGNCVPFEKIERPVRKEA